ncbi:MAG TPA: LLM class F420-dependent oxidoreductase [Kineosporiaceae bacterium]
MKLSLLASYADDPAALVRGLPSLEAAGLDMVWLSEAYSFDAVSVAGAVVQATSRLEVGTGILNVYSRTPALLAMTAATLDHLSGGRFTLGLGASGPQVIEGFHGVEYLHPAERVIDTIRICRTVWAREPLEYQGKAVTVPLPPDRGTGQGKALKLVNHPLRERIPIVWASMRPRAVRATAELADGWMPIFYLPERAAEVYGPALAEGSARRPADLGPLDVIAGGAVAVDDPAAIAGAVAGARAQLALYVGGMGSRTTNFYNDLVRRYGFEAEAERIQELYLAGRKREAAEAVPEELVQATNLIGSSGDVRGRIEAYRAAGVTTFCASGVSGDPVGTLATLRKLFDA